MRLRHTRSRAAFTLLEVLLASMLAIVLMAALYVALDVQLRLANDGREAVQQATVTRAVVQRINNDLINGLGPMTPVPDNSANANAMGTTGASTGAGTGTTGATTDASGMTTDASGNVVDMEMTAVSAIPFRAGLIGTSFANDDSGRLTIFVSRVAGVGRNVDESGESPNATDIRRITYWQTPNGLARQEIPWVTSEALQGSTEPVIEDGKEERDYVIAEEVVRIQFEFWDLTAQSWTSDWDGQEPGPDGTTPKGPPAAVRVKFWLLVPDPNGANGATMEKEFRHTIAILGAAGPAASDTDTATANQAAAAQSTGQTTGQTMSP